MDQSHQLVEWVHLLELIESTNANTWGANPASAKAKEIAGFWAVVGVTAAPPDASGGGWGWGVFGGHQWGDALSEEYLVRICVRPIGVDWGPATPAPHHACYTQCQPPQGCHGLTWQLWGSVQLWGKPGESGDLFGETVPLRPGTPISLRKCKVLGA